MCKDECAKKKRLLPKEHWQRDMGHIRADEDV